MLGYKRNKIMELEKGKRQYRTISQSQSSLMINNDKKIMESVLNQQKELSLKREKID